MSKSTGSLSRTSGMKATSASGLYLLLLVKQLVQDQRHESHQGLGPVPAINGGLTMSRSSLSRTSGMKATRATGLYLLLLVA